MSLLLRSSFFSLFVRNRQKLNVRYKVSRMQAKKKTRTPESKKNGWFTWLQHTHSCAQVYINAHLYCTKIIWNELLMKLKYNQWKLPARQYFFIKLNTTKPVFCTKHLSVKRRSIRNKHILNSGWASHWERKRKVDREGKQRDKKEVDRKNRATKNCQSSEIDRKLLWHCQSHNNLL